MTSLVNDDGTGPRGFARSVADENDTHTVAQAGFEAGLSVVVEAFPMACAVLDRGGRLVASNRAAALLVDGLRTPKTAIAIDAAMTRAHDSGSPIRISLDVCGSAAERFHVTSLTGPVDLDVALFLITEDTDPEPAFLTDEAVPSLSQNPGPSPIRVLREEAARFKRLSETDPLTGALNVRTFTAQVTQALQATPRPSGALICLDLNRFKVINDRFGHMAGDKVLIHVAEKLSFPAHTGILTARLGGDEFALWIPAVSPASLPPVTEGLRQRLRVPVDLSDEVDRKPEIRVKASIGAACCPDEALNYQAMRHLADQRLYEDKARFGVVANLRSGQRSGGPGSKRKGAVDPAPQSFLPR
ncbi:MAG: GGDEF domain-containing protein [Pseudomonadota bacterium]